MLTHMGTALQNPNRGAPRREFGTLDARASTADGDTPGWPRGPRLGMIPAVPPDPTAGPDPKGRDTLPRPATTTASTARPSSSRTSAPRTAGRACPRGASGRPRPCPCARPARNTKKYYAHRSPPLARGRRGVFSQPSFCRPCYPHEGAPHSRVPLRTPRSISGTGSTATKSRADLHPAAHRRVLYRVSLSSSTGEGAVPS